MHAERQTRVVVDADLRRGQSDLDLCFLVAVTGDLEALVQVTVSEATFDLLGAGVHVPDLATHARHRDCRLRNLVLVPDLAVRGHPEDVVGTVRVEGESCTTAREVAVRNTEKTCQGLRRVLAPLAHRGCGHLSGARCPALARDPRRNGGAYPGPSGCGSGAGSPERRGSLRGGAGRRFLERGGNLIDLVADRLLLLVGVSEVLVDHALELGFGVRDVRLGERDGSSHLGGSLELLPVLSFLRRGGHVSS